MLPLLDCGIVLNKNNEDNIYFDDEDGNWILTCDGNGDNFKIHEVELEKNSHGRMALAITDQGGPWFGLAIYSYQSHCPTSLPIIEIDSLH